MQRTSSTKQKKWQLLLLAVVLAACAAIAIPLTIPDPDQASEADRQPAELTLAQRDQLQPKAAVRAMMGEPIALLEAVALYIAIENSIAAGGHVDDLLENWDEVDLCRLAWPQGADALEGNDAVHRCVAHTLQNAQRQTYGDQFKRDAALRNAYGAMNEITIAALDPASWHPQLAYVTAPCRAGYRAYVRSVHTTLVDRMSIWEFVKDQFNYCILIQRKDAVEDDETAVQPTVTPKAGNPPETAPRPTNTPH